MLKKILGGIVAAITSPEAVRLERNLGSLIATRVLLAIGAGSGTVELVKHLIGG